MSSDKKRKIVEEDMLNKDESRASLTSKSTPSYVYIVYTLLGDPYTEYEQDMLAIYSDREIADSAAHEYYNKAWEKVSIPDQVQSEHESLRDGGYRCMPYEGGVDEDGELGNVLSVVLSRHGGGLRFGGRDEEDGITVVWVERRELNPSTIPLLPKARE